MANANRKYNDRFFQFLFGREERKEWTLSLYNAVRGSCYTNKDDVQINTIEEVLYLGMHNDVSFLISGELNLFEQQSTFNPNMPLRMLQYSAQLFEKYVRQNHLDKYGSYLLQLPVPRLIVFYNGTKDMPDESILLLSDSFPEEADQDIEVRVRMININEDHSRKIQEDCRPLLEYSWLIGRIRKNRAFMSLSDAIGKAIDEMPSEYLIRELLIIHKAEVCEMLETEYNEAEVLEIARLNAERRGEKRGKKLGREEFVSLLKKLVPGSDEYEKALNAGEEELAELYRRYGIQEEDNYEDEEE